MTNQIVKKSDWRTSDMPFLKIKYRFTRYFTEEEIDILKRGHIPQEMEDKWFWYFENDNLYAHRSWTGICIYKVQFNFKTGNHHVTINCNPKEYMIKGKKKDLQMLNSLLDFWMQPEYDYYGQWINETVDALQYNKKKEKEN